jgi:acyl-CoA synthetase (AMP-forming)/AMP-acid ligase II
MALLQSPADMTVRQISGDHGTVVEVLRAAAEEYGDAEAYVEPATPTSPRRHLTFAEWDRAADGAAGLLATLGVERGSVVCLYLPSSIDYMIGYAAAVRLGAVTSGINSRLGPREVTSILDRTRPAVTVVDPGLTFPHGPPVVGRVNGPGAAPAVPCPRPRRPRRRGVDEWDDRTAQGGRL